jgi:hypothetical protein
MRLAVFFIIIICCGLYSSNLQGQVKQPYRFEIEQKFNDEEFTVISLEEKGLALVRETNRYKAGNRSWELILLDTALTEHQKLDIEIDQQKTLIGYEYDSTHFYLLFKTAENLKTNLDLVEVNIRSAEIRRTEVKPELTITLSHFSKVGSNFVFGGYVNNEPAVLLFAPEQQNLKIIPGFFQKETELVELRGNKNNTFSVILIDRSQRDNRKLVFRIFDSSGKELLEDIIAIESKRSLQTAIVSSLVRDDLILLGTWGGMNSRQSAGLYGVPVDPFADQAVTYTAFAELENYLSYMKENKRKRITQKTTASLQAGRIPDFINYIRPIRIKEYNQGFLLLAEVFVPSSSSAAFRNNYPYFAPYPSPYQYYGPYYGNYPSYYNRMYNPFYYGNDTMRASDEIKITRSIVVSFSPTGKVAWDQALELDNIRLNSLEQVTDFCLAGQYLYFLYKKDSELRIKKINLETNEATEFSEQVRLQSSTDQLRAEREQLGGVRHWHNSSFYVWGVQNVRSTTNTDVGTKRVFYVNKVVFQ